MNKSAQVLRLFALLAAFALLVLGVAACGGSDSDTADATSASQDTAAATGSGESDQEVLDRLINEGTETEPPSEGPPPAKGKSVWWISCGQQLQDCALPTASAKEAAEKLGFDFNIADGKLNVGGGNLEALRTAIAAKPDMIVMHAIPCEVVQPALREAKQLGIPVMDVEGLDCSETPAGGPSLITAPMKYSTKAESTADYFRAWGQMIAEFMAADTGNATKYINNEGTASHMLLVNEGFDEAIAACGECESVANIEFAVPDLVPNGPWVQAFRSTLVKTPDAESAVLSYDVNLVVGGVQAVQETNPNVKIYGGSGQSMNLVREGKVAAQPSAHSAVWMGWAAMDNANRVLNGEETVPQGVGLRAVTPEANLPPKSDVYESPIDFKSQYESIWSAAK